MAQDELRLLVKLVRREALHDQRQEGGDDELEEEQDPTDCHLHQMGREKDRTLVKGRVNLRDEE